MEHENAAVKKDADVFASLRLGEGHDLFAQDLKKLPEEEPAAATEDSETSKKKSATEDEAAKQDEMDRRHFYNNRIYEARDTYKEDMEQYSLEALAILRDKTHFTSQNWRQRIDIMTEDPHLRKLVLEEKLAEL
jgi:hypothetical protein